MKIALLSYHFWYNYGTCFQAYALQQVLKKLGKDAEYLNFGWRYPINTNGYLEKFWSYTKPRTTLFYDIRYYLRRYKDAIIQHNLQNTLSLDLINYTNNKRFDCFHASYIKESETISDERLKDIVEDYDCFIVGSDQVWNPDCCERKYFTHFLLDFISSCKKKVSYGSSIGKSDVDYSTKKLFEKHLSSFAYLSCRENNGCELLRTVTNKKVQLVLDPTLLLSKEDWQKIAIPCKTKRKFVLCYILGDKKSIIEDAIELAQQKHLDIKIITFSPEIIHLYKKHVCKGVGPQEFLGLFNECDFFITDSFHGTAFAINFNKPFFSFFKREGDASISDNSRIPDLLNLFGLENRLRNKETDIDDTSIDFSNANIIMQELRDSSIEFLHKAIRK